MKNDKELYEQFKNNIAISKFKEENDIVMESKTKKLFKTIATTLAGILISTGVVFAGTVVYENIWKTWYIIWRNF